jgi:hypothetical protein
MNPNPTDENRELRQAYAKARTLMAEAANDLTGALEDQHLMEETPMEVGGAMESALEKIRAALRWLETTGSVRGPSAAPIPGGPTRTQGQFLAYLREYIMRNQSGVAPSHADFQRFFNLTAPSVNSMLIRLEQRGFIRRVRGKARAIELIINPEWIPPLDRPFKY